MIRAFRLIKTRHAATAFDGEGAFRFGGRWNHRGTRVAYASDSVALAVLEVVVHLGPGAEAYSVVPIEFPERIVEPFDPAGLPSNWRDDPAPISTRLIGDQWAREQRSAVLQVFSAIVPSERNFVINPLHADFAYVTIGAPTPFDLDPRIVRLLPP